ncbi:MAG TPA: glutathione S-transferase C-terminal domain-containing protein [Dyella sp.]
MKLHYLPGACSLAEHIVLEWIGAPYQAVSLGNEGIESTGRLARHCGGSAPMLEHADFSLTEDVAMLGYLADLHPEARLLGDGTPRGRAEVMRWLGFLNADVQRAFVPILKASLFLKEERLAVVLEENARQRVRAHLEQLDAQLDGRDWLAGTRSVADPYLFVILRWAVGMDIGLYGLTHLMHFARRMEADPGVQAALFAEEGVLA